MNQSNNFDELNNPTQADGTIASVDLNLTPYNNIIGKSVRIGHRDIDIHKFAMNDPEIRNYNGVYHDSQSLIKVDIFLHLDHLIEVLWHEILHAVYAIYKISDEADEEKNVSTIAAALVQIARDNPVLWDFLGKSIAAKSRMGNCCFNSSSNLGCKDSV